MKLWLIFLILIPLHRAERIYLLDTLNATSELGWAVYSSLDMDGWLEETYRSETKNLNHQAFSTCVVEQSNFENWLLLPRIERQEGRRLFFEVKFTMRKCHDIPNQASKSVCKETLKLYAHPVNSATLLPSHNWHNSTDWKLVETLAPNEDNGQIFIQTTSFAFDESSVYFSIKDSGSCSSVLYVKVYYEVCPEMKNTLTKIPRTIPGADLHSVVSVQGECIGNSSLVSGRRDPPKALCKIDGNWQMLTEECQCNPGFIYSRSANTCAPCGLNSFKPSHGPGECRPCPPNSEASKLASVICSCLPGFYRPSGHSHLHGCLSQPLANPDITVHESPNADDVLFPEPSFEQLKVGKNLFLVLCSTLVLLSVTMFGLMVICYKKSCQKRKQFSDLDVLDTYKQGTLTPDYGPNSKSAFSNTFQRKLNVPLIPAYSTSPRSGGIVNRYKPYVDPTTYENPRDALAEFTNEIPPENVEVTRTIGAGEFGEVCSGRLKVENVYGGVVQQIVAVKTLLPGSTDKAKADFLAEASIMGQFEHDNVIKLVGVVTKSEPVMILTEYMLNGSLDKFLRDNDDGKITVPQLIEMMHGIACGMKYLTDKGYVHRDLAARNVLVDDRLTCKIADFGLSRGVGASSEQEYTTQGGKIPIRWTAPEAISHNKYTAASDVWSFGVVMWEVCSFGERPYWDWTNHKVIQEVQGGFRLPRPMDCPVSLHEVMLECWQQERHKRPSFEQLVQRLSALLHQAQEEVSYSMVIENSPSLMHPRPSPPMTAPPVLTLPNFLRLHNLVHYIEVLNRNGITTVERLTETPYGDLISIGLHEADARRLIQYSIPPCRLSCTTDGVNPAGPGYLISGGTLRQNRSPLLSRSSIGTNHTTLTTSSHGSAGSPPNLTVNRKSPREQGFLV
ncbi:unnamed protein product [Bursaphelenchus xylophilus]|uniref:receptor protein-tyrosine kinase n=1 Tax=Bursaphelenchus xylophilus TaxID=6326 RepID=A0A1I7RPU7_BURXY|nr:unnamed protein product [Bursaphelenchus xylophilus]CAG9096654.1 unnamed protein product [Bursaphelenchus xylophilus]